jgi:hypothetical protein
MRLISRLFLSLFFWPASPAFAACTNPAGVAGDMIYNADYATMQFCNSSLWISMAGGGGSASVGTLTANNFCTSNAGGTQIVCTTASIGVSQLNATGTASSSTYLRGDGTWSTPSSGLSGGTANYIPLWSSSSALTSSVIYQSSGNVGIGTTSPGNPLVLNSSNANTEFDIQQGGTTGMSLYALANNYAVVNAATASTPLLFAINGSEKMRVNTTGYVGIGTTSPGVALDVAGAGNFTGNVTAATPTASTHLATKAYVDTAVAGAGGGSGAPTNFQVFTSSGTWTKPGSGTMARVECWAGGGGGGSCSGLCYGSGGGGYAYSWYALSSLTSTVAVTIGAGGTAGTSGGAGSAGGSSTFGGYLTAAGGSGGTNSSSNITAGGGGSGTNVVFSYGANNSSFNGGNSALGGGMYGVGGTGYGGAGTRPGGAGAGGSTAGGGAGAAGLCVVTAY